MARGFQYSIQGTLLGIDQISSVDDSFLDLSSSDQLTATAPVDLGSQPNGPAFLFDATNPDNDQSSARTASPAPSSPSPVSDGTPLTSIHDAADGTLARGSEPNSSAGSVIDVIDGPGANSATRHHAS